MIQILISYFFSRTTSSRESPSDADFPMFSGVSENACFHSVSQSGFDVDGYVEFVKC